MKDFCKLCNQYKELQDSHAIPDSIFHVMLKAGSGKAIMLTSDAKEISYTSDSLDTKQLCECCEKKINEYYESYSINLLRNTYKNVTKESGGIQFSDVDVDKFMKFILAIFWRAAISEHPSYKGAVMHHELYYKEGNIKLQECLYNNAAIPEDLFSVKIERLVDSSGYWDMKLLKKLIIPPFHHPYGKRKKVSVNFVIEGFYISIIMPCLSKKERREDIVLYSRGKQFFAKYKDFFSVPELKEIIIVSGLKIKNGHSSIHI